jgi:hypothetical protein
MDQRSITWTQLIELGAPRVTPCVPGSVSRAQDRAVSRPHAHDGAVHHLPPRMAATELGYFAKWLSALTRYNNEEWLSTVAILKMVKQFWKTDKYCS